MFRPFDPHDPENDPPSVDAGDRDLWRQRAFSGRAAYAVSVIEAQQAYFDRQHVPRFGTAIDPGTGATLGSVRLLLEERTHLFQRMEEDPAYKEALLSGVIHYGVERLPRPKTEGPKK